MGHSILIVDDSRELRYLISIMLEFTGKFDQIIEAQDGLMAVEMIKLYSPEIVVMDLAMPNMDGVNATKFINENYPDIKVIILTAHLSNYNCIDDLKVEYILQKGSSYGKIVQEIVSLLEEKF